MSRSTAIMTKNMYKYNFDTRQRLRLFYGPMSVKIVAILYVTLLLSCCLLKPSDGVPTSTPSLYYLNSPLVLSMISSMNAKSNGTSSMTAAGASAITSFTSTVSPPSQGPIEDALCRIEDLEQANDSQLYTILHELRQTAFFRTFLVNLDRKCPLQSWTKSKMETSHGSKKQETSETTPMTPFNDNTQEKKPIGDSLFGGASNEQVDSSEGDDDYQCTGGLDELDDDAEPLCTVASEDGDDDTMSGFSFTTTPALSNTNKNNLEFESNALYSLSKGGYQSRSQQEAFSWKIVTDQVVSSNSNDGREEISTEGFSTESCSDDSMKSDGRLLPDAFWNDMCRNLQVGITKSADDDYFVNTNANGKSNVVNLLLNPERNTGYNGTHIWRAIYEENCITVDGDDSHMCLEERVLYRMLSGLHTSTTVSIAMNYYPPSKRKNRINWEPNPAYFMNKFESNPDHIRNLHFSYAVMLRALHKASPFLYDYTSKQTNMYTGNTVEDETAIILLRRLLDSSILKSCSSVFTAFDESLMFQEQSAATDAAGGGDDNNLNSFEQQKKENSAIYDDVVSLQKNFKGVFHNVSSILDCVQCQQCKLHGKMTMLGYGTALKILFMDDNPILDRNEIVAFINTIAKFSESIRDVRVLTQLYWMLEHEQNLRIDEDNKRRQQISDGRRQQQQSYQQNDQQAPSRTSSSSVPSATVVDGFSNDNTIMSLNTVDTAIGLIASLGRENLIQVDREAELIQLALHRQPDLLLLAKHYSTDLIKFLKFSSTLTTAEMASTRDYSSSSSSSSSITTSIQEEQPDAIVVGSGLAGMAATLNILDRGGRVILLEKEHLLGGNSNKASSGINACCPTNTSSPTDSMKTFEDDTLKSAGEAARPDLVTTLVSKSASAVEWLRTRVGVDLSLTSQLGGHSDQRTHRPSNGMVGAEIIYGLQKAIKEYEKKGQIKVIMDAKVSKLLTSDDKFQVIGVEYMKTDDSDGRKLELRSPNVILATGGFASDRSKGSFLEQYRPELLRMPTTAGPFSTGDGVILATELGAGIVDMDKVQVHPTGWVDPSDPLNPSKTLAAELMRGVGGILLNDAGKRFCNELGTRSYVTDKMLSHNETYVKTGNWDIQSPIPTFSMILSSSAAADGAKKHVDLYTRKGLMTRLEGVTALAEWMGVPKAIIVSSLKAYQSDASKGKDQFGKTLFRNVPAKNLEKETFYAGTVTPVLHYCMGGITIDADGNVLNGETGEVINGLHAAGEVTGGVHGVNRLAGNSLLECTVFGTIVGQKISIQTPPMKNSNGDADDQYGISSNSSNLGEELRSISMSELQLHNSPEDCWVAIHGIVYDLTLFADEHPAGAESIHELAGTDGTSAFDDVHNQGILEDFDDERMGVLLSTNG